MAGMGPAPKPLSQRRRQNKTNAVMRLPRSGRQGRPPEWPLPTITGDRLDLWRELWGTPQAVAWEKLGWTRVVARYVEAVLTAEANMNVPLLAESRQLEDRLGLSPMAMLRLRWEMSDEDVTTSEGEGSSVTAIADYRAMLDDDGEEDE